MWSSEPSAAEYAEEMLARFPDDLLLDLIECLIARSAVLRAQRDTATNEGVFRVPKDLCRAWMQCVLSTVRDLQSMDDAQLARYLQVCTDP